MERYKAFVLKPKRSTSAISSRFSSNVPAKVHGIAPEQIPHFVNDHIVRILAGVPSGGRPRF